MSEGKEVIAYAITHAPRGQRGGPYEGSGAYGFPAGSLRTACRWYNGRPAEYTMQAVRVVVPTARVIRIVRKARPSETSAVEVLRDMLATWDDLGFVRTEAFARARAVLSASGPDPMPVVRAMEEPEELQRLREETRGLTEELRSLRADIMAVAAGGAVRWTKHAMGKAGLTPEPERRTIDNTPCTCGEANTQEKGRHDDDCPSVGL